MATEFIRELLEAGVHFGHQTKRWNPKMKQFIFGQRNGIYIIDLEKTAVLLETARQFLRETASKGGSILIVGTKKQAQAVVEEEAKKAGAFYVNQRWVGGLLTNFSTVRKSVKHLKDLERMREEGVFEKFSKKEVSRMNKEIVKLRKNFSGILEMNSLPTVIFVIDPKREETAIAEAVRLNVPVVALIDTNANPDLVDFPIPGNDDALRSIQFVTKLVAESIAQGRREFLQISAPVEEEAKKEDPQEIKADVAGETAEGLEEAEEVIVEDVDVEGKKKHKPKKVTED